MNQETYDMIGDKINNMQIIHHPRILKILTKHKCNVSENANGCHVKLENISNELMEELLKYIAHIDIVEEELV